MTEGSAGTLASPAVAIELRGLVKTYAGRAVVDGLDLTVRRGEILGLLGPNGAGKTTTVEMIEGYRAPDGGSVRVLGLDPRRDGRRLKPRLGLMLQRGEFYSQIRVDEAVELFRAFYDDPLPTGSLLEALGLTSLLMARYRTLSGGERQRLALALALVGRPEVAILDEPTSAMDPAARRATWGLLRELRDRGAAILLTTHLLEEAEQLADRVAIIDAGHLVAAGTPAELRRAGSAQDGTREVLLELAEPLSRDHEAALGRLPSARDARRVRDGLYAITTGEPVELLTELGPWLLATGREPLSIQFGRGSLAEVFLRLIGQEDGA